MAAQHRSAVRRHPVIASFAALLAVLVIASALFDWNWLRGPVERAASARLHREVRIGDIAVDWGREPVMRLRDLYLGNFEGGARPAMATIGQVEARLALRDLFKGKLYITRVAVSDADVLLERMADGRANWMLVQPDPDEKPDHKPPQRVGLGGVSINQGQFRYLDHKMDLDATVLARPLDAQTDAAARQSGSAPVNHRYATRFDLKGDYRGNGFSGNALTGDVLSLQESGLAFPVKAELTAGKTRIRMEGTVADAAKVSGMDVQLQIAGETMANLYPFLLLPLPATPPYELHGRLRLDQGRYAIDDLAGKIGSTDVQGRGSYLVREPRPLLGVQLTSDLLDITDLGPLIGVETKSRTGDPAAQTANQGGGEQAKASDEAGRGDKLLPTGRFDPAKLRLIDADVSLDARKLKVPGRLPLESLQGTLRLQDAVLKLDPLRIGVAGGRLEGRATLDARNGDALGADVQMQMRQVRLDRLMPDTGPLARGAGLVGAQMNLKGQGNSIADVAAKADGRLSVAMANGRISNLLDAASGVNIGKALGLLARGDRDIAVNCGATVVDVKSGQGHTSVFVIDTEQTQVVGSGDFDLDQERFAMKVEPKPKSPSLLSLRTPVHVQGSFADPTFSVEKTPLALRLGGALALGAVAPVAALIPLIETGPGEDTGCRQVLAAAGDARSKAQESPR